MGRGQSGRMPSTFGERLFLSVYASLIEILFRDVWGGC